MKMIRPIVNISKVIDDFDTVVLGLRGVLTDGIRLKPEALNAIIQMKKHKKNLVLITNSAERVLSIANFFTENGFPAEWFDVIISSGEILHYKLKAKTNEFKALGSKYYLIGKYDDALKGLDYEQVDNIAYADFLYVSSVNDVDDSLNTYLPLLEHAASLSIPFVCVGNEKSTFMDDKVCLAPAALAEQYAVLGGKIISVGKPDVKIFNYALDGIDKSKILFIGDNITTDIKGAESAKISSVLVSKGVHINFLGEGYIPDVAKTRELTDNFNVTPNFAISNLRW